jgi:hypothetical protein
MSNDKLTIHSEFRCNSHALDGTALFAIVNIVETADAAGTSTTLLAPPLE